MYRLNRVEVNMVSNHLKEIFKSGKLEEESVIRKDLNNRKRRQENTTRIFAILTPLLQNKKPRQVTKSTLPKET